MRCEGARPKRLVSLKEMSARVALLRMQRDGLLRLPAPLRTLARPRPISASPATDPPRLLPLPGSLDEVRPLRLDPLRPKDPRSRIWNEFVDRYHYLGHKNLPGAQLRYFVHARDGLPLALLAQLERCLPADWHSRYNLRPVLLETFCQTPRFRGTCYRAANWIHLGPTLGRGKLDTHNQYALPIKDIFVKPLCADWKAVLNR